ncbi:hypothetical protein [Nitrosomonas sp.]|uniref:hypothetical protein n=1 Tax=Nitrosomonas sp. TaxID=42353 RepID=UPI0025CDE66D|nr:hypothetical protein [Nitrosomonas sp.]MBY0483459.1 hypothetical protein [Nitrosomonas sp.]
MENLKKYLKSLSSPDERVEFAKSCGTTIGYVRKVISSKGSLLFGPIICRKMEERSSGIIDRRELRPNDWSELWPELLQQGKTNSDKAA